MFFALEGPSEHDDGIHSGGAKSNTQLLGMMLSEHALGGKVVVKPALHRSRTTSYCYCQIANDRHT